MIISLSILAFLFGGWATMVVCIRHNPGVFDSVDAPIVIVFLLWPLVLPVVLAYKIMEFLFKSATTVADIDAGKIKQYITTEKEKREGKEGLPIPHEPYRY